jgi:hypothetical protein
MSTKSGSGLKTVFTDAVFASSGSGKAKAKTPTPNNPNKSGKK